MVPNPHSPPFSTLPGGPSLFSIAAPAHAQQGRARECGRGGSGPEGAAEAPQARGLSHRKQVITDHPDGFTVSFDPQEKAINRLKRLRHQTWLSGYLLNMQAHQQAHRPDQPWFITLTYDSRGTLGNGAHTWTPDHIAETMVKYRRWCRRKGVPCRYTWVAELQTNGQVHYHLMAWLPRGVRMPRWDRPTTYRGRQQMPFWSRGMSNRQPAKQGIAYLMKYLSKMGKYHEFPHGCRTHGAGGLDEHSRLLRQWYNLPQWVKNQYGVGDVFRMKNDLGQSQLVVLATGQCLPPMYRRYLLREPGHKAHGVLMVPTGPLPPRLHDGPYSTWSPPDE